MFTINTCLYPINGGVHMRHTNGGVLSARNVDEMGHEGSCSSRQPGMCGALMAGSFMLKGAVKIEDSSTLEPWQLGELLCEPWTANFHSALCERMNPYGYRF